MDFKPALITKSALDALAEHRQIPTTSGIGIALIVLIVLIPVAISFFHIIVVAYRQSRRLYGLPPHLS